MTFRSSCGVTWRPVVSLTVVATLMESPLEWTLELEDLVLHEVLLALGGALPVDVRIRQLDVLVVTAEEEGEAHLGALLIEARRGVEVLPGILHIGLQV